MAGFVFRLIPARPRVLAAAEALRDVDPAMPSPHGFHTEIAPMLQLLTPHGEA